MAAQHFAALAGENQFHHRLGRFATGGVAQFHFEVQALLTRRKEARQGMFYLHSRRLKTPHLQTRALGLAGVANLQFVGALRQAFGQGNFRVAHAPRVGDGFHSEVEPSLALQEDLHRALGQSRVFPQQLPGQKANQDASSGIVDAAVGVDEEVVGTKTLGAGVAGKAHQDRTAGRQGVLRTAARPKAENAGARGIALAYRVTVDGDLAAHRRAKVIVEETEVNVGLTRPRNLVRIINDPLHLGSPPVGFSTLRYPSCFRGTAPCQIDGSERWNSIPLLDQMALPVRFQAIDT